MAGVGTQKVFEDERIIVWHFDLEPGQAGELHTHELDYVVRVVSGASLEVRGPDGELLYAVDREPGGPMSFRIHGDQIVSEHVAVPAIPATHSVHNVGRTTFREVLIEFRK